MAEISDTSGSLKRKILLAAVVSAFLNSFMASAINLALPSIGEEFSADAILLGWIATAYLLSSAVFLVPFGRIADIYGRRKVFLWGMAIFSLASAGSSFAPGIYTLIIIRVLQGVGSAMIFATGIAIVTSVFPAEERGKAFGLTIAAVYIGLSFGPFAGGMLTDYLGWRSVFLFTAVAGMAGVLFIGFRIRAEWAEAAGEPFDLQGSVIYGISLFLLIYGFSSLPSARGFACLGTGSAGIVMFLAVQLKTRYPVMQLKLFVNNPVFAWSNAAALINYSATFAVAFLLSLYLQYIKGLTASDAGLVLVSQPVVMAVVSPLAGRLSDRIEPRILATAGMAVTTAGLFFLSFAAVMSITTIIITLVLLGTGFGLFSSPNSNAIMSAVTPKYYGIASGTMGTMRLLGQMFSMGVVMLILALYIGREPVTEQNSDVFLESLRVAFWLFSALCFLGIFASYARGDMRTYKSK